MHTKDNDSQIEFALQILNQRDQLDNNDVERWLDVPEHRRLLDELVQIKQLSTRLDYNQLRSKEWDKLQKSIENRQRRVVYRWLYVAASLFLLIGFTIFLQYVKKSEPIQEMVKCEQPYGSNRARLHLANGQVIPLNQNIQIQDDQVSNITNDTVVGINYQEVQTKQENDSLIYNILEVPVGGFYKLELSDGSMVWLNADSELRFPVQFAQTEREVFLKGEGYFQIAPDSLRKFIVHLEHSDVTVLGTTFNVSAYRDESHIYTTLTEGSVSFYSHLTQQQYVLQPGMQSAMDVYTGETKIAKVDPTLFSTWIDGAFVFHALELKSILRQLQRWYDFELIYLHQDTKRYEFRGMLNRDMDLREVLDIIEETTDLKFNIEGRTVTVSSQ